MDESARDWNALWEVQLLKSMLESFGRKQQKLTLVKSREFRVSREQKEHQMQIQGRWSRNHSQGGLFQLKLEGEAEGDVAKGGCVFLWVLRRREQGRQVEGESPLKRFPTGNSSWWGKGAEWENNVRGMSPTEGSSCSHPSPPPV